VPWTESFEVDENVFRRSLEGHLARGFAHLYLFGTAGEGYAVTLSQFERIARIFVDETRGKAASRQLGVIALSIPQVRERIELGLSLGIDSFQLSLPSWGKLRDAEVELFFDEICGRYPQATFLFYNVPRGLRLLSPAELGVLSGRHANLVAVKWAGRWDISQIRSALEMGPLLSHFFTDIRFAEAGLAGLKPSLLLALSAASARIAHELFRLVQTGEGPQRLQTLLADLQCHNEIFRELSLGEGRIDGTFDKLIAKLVNEEFPLRLLPPYQGSSDEVFELYRQKMRTKLPHWFSPA
jgi:dihydrodipicolinate synthase/N-acetylneuraminate lyase